MSKAWFETFFHGLALEFWRRAMTPALTATDADFLEQALGLEPRAAVLDVPCGDGRLSLELARRGYAATGVDLASEFLADARRAARQMELKARWKRGDMRRLPDLLGHEPRFDAAFCYGNSFGYFNRRDTAAFLKGLAPLLRPGGRFLVDTGAVAESILPQMDERIWMPVGDLVMLAENDYDPAQSRLVTDFTFIQGNRRQTGRAVQWVFTVGEISDMLADAGLHTVERWSDLERTPFAYGAPRLLLLAEKTPARKRTARGA